MTDPSNATTREATYHPALEGIDGGDTIQFAPSERDGAVVGTIDEYASNPVPGGHVHLVVETLDDELWDLEAEHDPREADNDRAGWSPLRAAQRVYLDTETLIECQGTVPVDAIRPVRVGVPLEALTAGADMTVRDGHTYRVVIPPEEYPYGDTAKAFNLDDGANVLTRLDPSEVVAPADREGDSDGDAEAASNAWPWFDCPECEMAVWVDGFDDATTLPAHAESREVAHCGVCELVVIRRV